MKFPCQHCEQSIEAADDLAGRVVSCPRCHSEVVVPKYWAFLSYSHQDNVTVRRDGTRDCVRWAEWLHKSLESYRVPGHFRNHQTPTGENMPRRFFPVFQDDKELSANEDLGQSIRTALDQSRFLIVICSPRSAASTYVNEEVRYFKQLGRAERIRTFIVDGEPNASSGTTHNVPKGMECFCPELRLPLGVDGLEDAERLKLKEQIAADVRVKLMDPPREASGSDLGRGHRQELKKMKLWLISGLMGVGSDELVRRDRIARRFRMVRQVGITLSVIAALAIAGIEAFKQRNLASKQRAAVDEWTQRYSEAYGEKADAERLRAVSDALADAPPPFETLSAEWKPLADDDAARATYIRAEMTRGLPEISWDKIIRPSDADTGQAGQRTDVESGLPERFVLTGKLAAVRLIEGRSYVYVTESTVKNNFYESPYAGILMPLACVIFESSNVAESMVDYSAGDRLSITLRRHSWKDPILSNPKESHDYLSFLPAPMRQLGREWCAFLTAPESPNPLDQNLLYHLYWCFYGDGLEKTGRPETWITLDLCSMGKPSKPSAVARSPGRMFRSLPLWTGTRGIIRGKFDSSYQEGGRVFVKLTIPDSIEGPLEATIDMGPEVGFRAFRDFQPGDPIESDITLTAPSPSGEAPARIGQLVSTGTRQAFAKKFQSDPTQQSMMVDPLLMWDQLAGSARWIRIHGKPETLILASSPRSRAITTSPDGILTPEAARSNLTLALGKEVTWTGILAETAKSNGQTHLKISLGRSAVGLDSFEVVSDHPALLEELADYIAQNGQKMGDEVSVTGIVRPPEFATFRLAKDSPLLELRAIQRTRNASSRIVAGTKRNPDTMKPLTPAMTLTSPATTTGQHVTWTGTLKRIAHAQGESHLEIDDDVSGSFEAVTNQSDFVGQLSDYVTRQDAFIADKVSITGQIRLPDGLKFRLKGDLPLIEIELIQRVGDALSKVVAGHKRDPSTLRKETVQPEFVLLRRNSSKPGEKVQMFACYGSFNSFTKAVDIRPRASGYSHNISVIFPNCLEAWFADYKPDDIVEVFGTVSALSTDYNFVLDGKSIVRVTNPASLITNDGRNIPVVDAAEVPNSQGGNATPMQRGTVASNQTTGAPPQNNPVALSVDLSTDEYFTKERIVFSTDSGVQSIPAATRVRVVGGQQGKLMVSDGRVQIQASDEVLTRDPDIIKGLLARAKAAVPRPSQPPARSQTYQPTPSVPRAPNSYVASQIASVDAQIAHCKAEIKKLEEAESQSRRKGRISSAGASISRWQEKIKQLHKDRAILQQKL